MNSISNRIMNTKMKIALKNTSKYTQHKEERHLKNQENILLLCTCLSFAIGGSTILKTKFKFLIKKNQHIFKKLEY
ncbi:hypothetical protein BpHYR1_026472 [Brachionus plicatilis]|uniref:Uncharacterized protein n=1 Tax=Brachionus plicatilis TaxID=10195 RepID=A0A3M7QGZ5_BRAPC|nr:hypothetical protein BpHYR1_026472 [Brachionus plicatilis]